MSRYISNRPSTSSPLPFTEYFSEASSIVSPSPSPVSQSVDQDIDIDIDIDINIDTDMKAGNPSKGSLKAARVQAYVRQAKKEHSLSHHSLVPSGKNPGMTPGMKASIAKMRYSPSTQLMIEINKYKEAQHRGITREQLMLMEEEYAEEITDYLHTLEAQKIASATLMDQQPELRWEMRPCLVDFIIEVHLLHRLKPETLYLAINIIDRYVSKRVVLKKHYQLVGCAALWIAAKYEDQKDRAPTVHELAEVCRNAYEPSAFLQMEQHVLNTLDWNMSHTTAESWLRMRCSGDYWESQRTQHVARFIMELTTFKREFINYVPSEIAHGSLILAKYVLGEPRARDQDTEQVREVAELLDGIFFEGVHKLSDTVVKKYSPSYYSSASRIVLEWYGAGNRYCYNPFPQWQITLPRTPSSLYPRPEWPDKLRRSSSSLDSISPMASEDGDSMPATPVTPLFHVGKENATASARLASIFGKEEDKSAGEDGEAPPAMSKPDPVIMSQEEAIAIMEAFHKRPFGKNINNRA